MVCSFKVLTLDLRELKKYPDLQFQFFPFKYNDRTFLPWGGCYSEDRNNKDSKLCLQAIQQKEMVY